PGGGQARGRGGWPARSARLDDGDGRRRSGARERGGEAPRPSRPDRPAPENPDLRALPDLGSGRHGEDGADGDDPGAGRPAAGLDLAHPSLPGGCHGGAAHPQSGRRRARTRGAAGTGRRHPGRSPANPAKMGMLIAIVAPLALLIAVLLGVVVVLATGLTVVFMMIPLLIVYAVFEWLF